jgi:hypothetical protein
VDRSLATTISPQGSLLDAVVRELEEARLEVQVARAERDRYQKAAELLAHKCAQLQMDAQKERARLIDDHDAFIIELSREHDRLIAEHQRERDAAREQLSEALSTREGAAAAQRKVARARVRARLELGEMTLERDVARRDAARAQRQLADARAEIQRLRREVASLGELAEPPQSRRSSIPMPRGVSRSSAPPAKRSG